jgi:hypothetical protein
MTAAFGTISHNFFTPVRISGAGFKHGRFAIHEKKRLDANAGNVVMTTDRSVSSIQGNASSIKKVVQRTIQHIVGNVVISCNESQLA